MDEAPATHRATVDKEFGPYDRARAVLGTRGNEDTVNQAPRRVERMERLRRGAAVILGENHEPVTPGELEQIRRPPVA